MTRTLEIRPDIDDGIDRKVLATLRTRFLAVNAARLERALAAMSTRQQQVLKLLPLLFHVNHPILPGYISATTPAGLANFEPDAEQLAEAQRLSRSFAYKPRRTGGGSKPPAPIHGLFLMGSLGTVAQAAPGIEEGDDDRTHQADLSGTARVIHLASNGPVTSTTKSRSVCTASTKETSAWVPTAMIATESRPPGLVAR